MELQIIATTMFSRELIVMAVLLLVFPVWRQSTTVTSRAGEMPIAIACEEVARHRIERQPILRVQWNARMTAELAMEGVTVKAVASADGVVTSAKART
jgi:hypothetical protein